MGYSHVVALGDNIHEFWAACRVDLSTRIVNGSHCRIWTRNRSASGYGNLKVRRRTTRAHRHIWSELFGPIPEGLVIRHMCNNGHLGCVEPLHLDIGTPADNTADMIRAGRKYIARGVTNGSAKLTSDQVIEIRALVSSGVTYRAIAACFDINPATVSLIKSRKNWGWLA